MTTLSKDEMEVWKQVQTAVAELTLDERDFEGPVGSLEWAKDWIEIKAGIEFLSRSFKPEPEARTTPEGKHISKWDNKPVQNYDLPPSTRS